MKPEDFHVGIYVVRRRKALKLTQEQLAERVGLTRASVANIETGRHQITIEHVRTFAKALDVEIDSLIP